MPIQFRVHGKLDVLVANAGILGMLQQPQEVDEENWKNVFATNVVRWSWGAHTCACMLVCTQM